MFREGVNLEVMSADNILEEMRVDRILSTNDDKIKQYISKRHAWKGNPGKSQVRYSQSNLSLILEKSEIYVFVWLQTNCIYFYLSDYWLLIWKWKDLHSKPMQINHFRVLWKFWFNWLCLVVVFLNFFLIVYKSPDPTIDTDKCMNPGFSVSFFYISS